MQKVLEHEVSLWSYSLPILELSSSSSFDGSALERATSFCSIQEKYANEKRAVDGDDG
jgi:hypothetical protein